jgi:cytochrome b561
MTAAFTLVGLRLLLHPRDLARLQLLTWLTTLGLAGVTLLLGRLALAWREGRSTRAALPRLHRTFGTATLIGLALTTVVWLLRNRA